MTAAVRATILVIALLIGATAAAALSIAMWSPARGGEAQDFWREIQPAPRKARRIIMVTYRLHRARFHPDNRADRARPGARDGDERLGSRASVPEPSDDSADSFARRYVLPEPPRNIYVPPDLMQRDEPLQIFTPPRERKEPGNNRTRELCVAAVIVVAALGSVASFLSIPERGIVHG